MNTNENEMTFFQVCSKTCHTNYPQANCNHNLADMD